MNDKQKYTRMTIAALLIIICLLLYYLFAPIPHLSLNSAQSQETEQIITAEATMIEGNPAS